MNLQLAPHPTKKQGHLAGIIYLALIVFGIFAELTRQVLVIPDNAEQTAGNITNNELLFRFAFLSDLLMIVSFLFLALLLYHIFSDTDRQLSIVFTILVIVCIPILALNMMNHMIPLMLLTQPDRFSSLSNTQIQELSMFFLELHSMGYIIVQLFFGLWLLPLGLVVIKFGYIPRIIGILLIVASISQLVDLVGIVLLATYSTIITMLMILPSVIGEFSFAFWILFRGIDISDVATTNKLAT